MSVSINGKSIKDMPVTVAVIPPYTSLRLKQTITAVSQPFDLDFTDNGDAFVGGWSYHHVHHFDRSGNKLNSWRTPGNNPHSILVHGSKDCMAQTGVEGALMCLVWQMAGYFIRSQHHNLH